MSAKNRSFASLVLSAVLFATPLAACAGADLEVDELAADESDVATDGKADAVGSNNFTYYLVRRDTRKCVSPMCAGYWVERVNRATTRCADGSFKSECYVAELNLAGLGVGLEQERQILDAAEGRQLVVRGTVVSKSFGGFGNLGEYVASEAWIAGTDAEPSGVFARVTDSGIRCITFPCPSLNAAKLNGFLTRAVAGLDFAPSRATDEQIGTAYQATSTEDGLLVAGHKYMVTGPAGSAPGRTVTQFYLRVVAAPDAGTACYAGGCSGQVCSDNPDVITTCEWRPEYACYAGATCARQADGACGWTETAELLACLENPSGE